MKTLIVSFRYYVVVDGKILLGTLVRKITWLIFAGLLVSSYSARADISVGPAQYTAGPSCIENLAPVSALVNALAERGSSWLQGCHYSVVVHGEIKVGDLADLQLLIEAIELHDAGIPLRLGLKSHGGNAREAMEIGRLISNHQLFEFAVAVLLPKEVCASSCVLVLAGARRRLVVPGTKVGIHRLFYAPQKFAVLDNDKQRLAYKYDKQVVDSYLLEMGVLGGLADAMWRVPSNTIKWLTREELQLYGLNEDAVEVQEAFIAVRNLACEEGWSDHEALLKSCDDDVLCYSQKVIACETAVYEYQKNSPRP